MQMSRDDRKEVGFQMVQIFYGIWNLKASWPFEIQKNGCHFVCNHLKSKQKCPDFEWFGFQKVVTVINIDVAQGKF